MRISKSAGLIGVTSAWLFTVTAVLGHDDHKRYGAGEPGDPRKPSHAVAITMYDRSYQPARLEVRRGEQIRFVVRNEGFEEHEFLLATTDENLKHAEAMRKNPGMEHDEPNGVRLDPGKSAEVLWKFTKAGTFEFGCLIAGHREDGMTGTIVVK
ncbi:MAG: cupredoxin domain-containing protein [Afipia sp.]